MAKGKQHQFAKSDGRSIQERREALADPESDLSKTWIDRAPSEQKPLLPACGGKLSVNSEKYKEWQAAGSVPPRPTCTQPAGFGTEHSGFGYCKWHGGSTAAGIKSAAKQQVRQWVEERRRTLGDRNDPSVRGISPDEVLLEEVRRSVALVRWLEEKIGSWDLDPESFPMAEHLGLPQLVAETATGSPGATDAQVWLLIYREERKHMVSVAKLTLDAGIAERQVRLAEQQGLLLATAIRSILNALNLTPEQQSQVPHVVPGILRQLSVDSRQPGVAVLQGELARSDA